MLRQLKREILRKSLRITLDGLVKRCRRYFVELSKVGIQHHTLAADNGYYSRANVEESVARGVDPLIAMGRERYDIFQQASEELPGQSPVERMRHRLSSAAGRRLYARRKCTIEPVFGIIKHVMGFRQFSLRGLEKVQGEWTLVSMAWNLKRMAKLQAMMA